MPPARLLVALSSIFLFLGCTLIAFTSIPSLGRNTPSRNDVDIVPSFHRAPKENIWTDLDAGQLKTIVDYLHNNPTFLNLTHPKDATANDNKLVLLETLHPNKTDAIRYLDSELYQFTHWVRLVVSAGSSEKAELREYMFGQPPGSREVIIEPLTYRYNAGRNYVDNIIPDYMAVAHWFAEVLMEKVSGEMLVDLLGDAMNPMIHPELPPIMVLASRTREEDGRVMFWGSVTMTGKRGDAWSLLQQGVYVKLEMTGRNKTKWGIHEWYYNGVLYNSVEDFTAAWSKPGFKKSPPNLDGDWTKTEDFTHNAKRDKPPPIMVHPKGPRYDLDEKQKWVSWMDWSFFFATSKVTGVSLFDVRFRDERIMYELSLQEAMAHYAGTDPFTNGVAWLDTFFGMGLNTFELVPGYDCPAYADYLPMTFYDNGNVVTRNNTICLFEYTADYALQRHTSFDHVTVARNTYLVLRFISTVGNYDYTFDYTFYLDGAFEVKYRASGFVFGSYHIPMTDLITHERRTEETHGFQIQDMVASSMHDHVLNFKADLDIAGPNNTFCKIDVAPTTVQYPFDSHPRNSMHLIHTPSLNETSLNWPSNSASLYIILNTNATNKYHQPRGYRIMPGTSGGGAPPHLTITNSSALGHSAAWATADLHIVRQHDTEPRSASELAFLDPDSPLIDFAKFLDGESVSQEDLVAYFNLGSHHVPHSGDIPNTLSHTAASSVMFAPFNYFDYDVSRDTRQGVRIDLPVGRWTDPIDKKTVTHFGAHYHEGMCLGRDDIEPDLLEVYQAEGHDVTDLTMGKSLVG